MLRIFPFHSVSNFLLCCLRKDHPKGTAGVPTRNFPPATWLKLAEPRNMCPRSPKSLSLVMTSLSADSCRGILRNIGYFSLPFDISKSAFILQSKGHDGRRLVCLCFLNPSCCVKVKHIARPRFSRLLFRA